MAALLRQGARRIGGSVLQRTQAAVTSPAVAEERRRLVPRRMSTDAEAKATDEIQQKKEELYVALSKVDNWQNRLLLQDLAAHIKPRKHDRQWRRLTASRWFTSVVRTVGSVSFAHMLLVVFGGEGYVEEKKKIVLTLLKLDKEQEQSKS